MLTVQQIIFNFKNKHNPNAHTKENGQENNPGESQNFQISLKKLDSEEVPLNVEAKFKNGAIKALLKLMIQNTNLSK